MKLGLRRKNLMFFLAIAAACLGAIALGVFIVSRGQTGADASIVLNMSLIAGFAIAIILALAWLMVDERIVKPILQLATDIRARAENNIDAPIDTSATTQFEDLAPAAAALHKKSAQLRETVRAATADLEAENQLLATILSDLPVATFILGASCRIVLYDRQAAELMAAIAPPRLHSSIFDYFEDGKLRPLLEKIGDNQRAVVHLTDKSGTVHKNVRVKHLAENGGYLLMITPKNQDTSLHIERPITFNFDLLNTKPANSLLEAKLSEIDFTVFDTETTGLDPKVDELIQIGGVRVVQGMIVEGETFDKYIKPSRPIPAASTRVHGITDDYVADAASAIEVIDDFMQFSHDTVLAAHNAPFDWQFLNRVKDIPKRPVLDTVLVSAILYGRTGKHSLDALCERLHITIPETERHTGIGDSIATAKALCAMIPMLEANGILTFADYQQAAEKFSRLLEQVN